MKPSKETRRAEGRDRPGGIPRVEARVRTQSRAALPPNLARVNAAAQQAAQTRFTALLHHVDIAALERAFRRQKRLASAGVDGMTVAAYEQDLEANLRDLCTRVHTRRYRPQPVRRVYIPKADGGQRPARRADSGGQDRSGCSRRASQRRLPGRFPRLLLRLPAKTEPAYGSFGAAYGADEPARELGARCRPSQLFRFGRPRMAAADGGA